MGTEVNPKKTIKAKEALLKSASQVAYKRPRGYDALYKWVANLSILALAIGSILFGWHAFGGLNERTVTATVVAVVWSYTSYLGYLPLAGQIAYALFAPKLIAWAFGSIGANPFDVPWRPVPTLDFKISWGSLIFWVPLLLSIMISGEIIWTRILLKRFWKQRKSGS